MSANTPADLPPDIAELLAAERTVPPAPAAARADVLAKVQSVIATGSVATAATAGTSLVLKGLAVAVLVVSGVAGGLYATRRPERHAPPAPITTPPRVPLAPTPSPILSATPIAPEPTTVPPENAAAAPIVQPSSTQSAPVASAHDHDDDLAQENALIDTARDAISAGRSRDALEALSEHARRFTRGRLVEERDALRVEALVGAGQVERAHEEAEHFRRAHPSSTYLPVLDQALGAER